MKHLIHLPPPYRLETMAAVRAFVRPRPDENEKALLSFATSSAAVIEKPPVLALLPAKCDIEMREVNTSIRWMVRDVDLANKLNEAGELIRSEQEHFLAAVQDLQNDYFQVFRRIKEEGKVFVKVRKSDNVSLEQDGAPAIISDSLQDQSDAYELLVSILRRYLHTRRKELLIFLKLSITRILAFQPANHVLDGEMVNRFRHLSPTSSLILNDLFSLYVERLERLKKNMFLPHARHFWTATKQKLGRLSVSPHVKRNIIDVLNGVRQASDIDAARRKLAQYLKMYEERLDPGALLCLKNILDNFFEKLAAFEDFFQKLCSSARIRDLYALFCKDLHVRKIDIESLSVQVMFTLYPCKDLHDFLKGHYSGDCSSASKLAAAHLLHRRFFNIRIFRDKNWIGCIYMLDFSDRGVLILDRIQIGNKDAFVMINFFHQFIKQFASFVNMGNNFTLLAPPKISNFTVIQESFQHYAKKLPKMAFVMGAEDRIFESAHRKLFYVIDN